MQSIGGPVGNIKCKPLSYLTEIRDQIEIPLELGILKKSPSKLIYFSFGTDAHREGEVRRISQG
jgi:hypothetical protein